MNTETDRELLEWAAKAAGMPLNYKDGWVWCENVGPGKHWGLWKAYSKPTSSELNPRPIPILWNPLTDDGDALRLAVKLEMMVDYINRGYMVGSVVAAVSQVHNGSFYEPREPEPYAATRRAIVRAAAEIGKAMK